MERELSFSEMSEGVYNQECLNHWMKEMGGRHPSDPGAMRDWLVNHRYVPYQRAIDFSRDVSEQDWEDVDGQKEPVGELVEIISMPWWENGKIRINVRAPDDPTTMREVEWPHMHLYPQTSEEGI